MEGPTRKKKMGHWVKKKFTTSSLYKAILLCTVYRKKIFTIYIVYTKENFQYIYVFFYIFNTLTILILILFDQFEVEY